MSITRFSLKLNVFHGRNVPKEGVIVGYGAIIEAYKLAVPIPQQLSFVSKDSNKAIIRIRFILANSKIKKG